MTTSMTESIQDGRRISHRLDRFNLEVAIGKCCMCKRCSEHSTTEKKTEKKKNRVRVCLCLCVSVHFPNSIIFLFRSCTPDPASCCPYN